MLDASHPRPAPAPPRRTPLAEVLRTVSDDDLRIMREAAIHDIDELVAEIYFLGPSEARLHLLKEREQRRRDVEAEMCQRLHSAHGGMQEVAA